MIELINISKAFGDKTVIENFNLQVKDTETIALMGKSGIGKTTLLNIIAGFLKPDSGELRNVPADIAMVFQENRLLDDFSAYDNIRLICGAVHKDILVHFAELELASHIDKPVRDYSGGMKRRVALMRAMLAKSSLILMDEPFKGLDKATKERTIAYTKKHIKRKTCIIITHDMQEAKDLEADRIIQMEGD